MPKALKMLMLPHARVWASVEPPNVSPSKSCCRQKRHGHMRISFDLDILSDLEVYGVLQVNVLKANALSGLC